MMSLLFAVFLMAGDPAAAPAASETAPATPAAQTTGPAAPAKGAKAAPGPNDMVCKSEAIVGSRFKSRVCLTRQEWEQRRDDSRDELSKAQRNQPFETH